MNITLRKMNVGYYPRRQRTGWQRGFVHATVDGHTVSYRETHGWECLHIDAVADLIDENTLARIERGREGARSA